MHIDDSYQVEVRSLVNEKWETVQCFRPRYKWHCVTRCILGLLRWTRRQIVTPHIRALIAKGEAHQYARNAVHVRYPRHVRITCIEREGKRLVKFVVWQDGRWYE